MRPRKNVENVAKVDILLDAVEIEDSIHNAQQRRNLNLMRQINCSDDSGSSDESDNENAAKVVLTIGGNGEPPGNAG